MRSDVSRQWRWLALLAVLVLVLAACADDDDEAETDDDDDDETTEVDEEPDEDDDDDEAEEEPEGELMEGGTVLFGDEQEPTILNGFLLDGNSLVTSKVNTNVLAGSHKVHPDFTIQPYALDGEAEVTEDPFTVTYTIREEAAWNDGTTLSANDYAFTYETIMADWDITSRAGYELIEDYEIVDEKTITFNFSDVYAPWQLMFNSILPEHALEGEDFDVVWNTELVNPKNGEPISAGPYQFDSWDQGQQLRLVRNENYWGETAALDEIVMRYVPDTTTLTQQMRGGEIDMYDPQPQIELVEQLEEITDRITYEVGVGPVWEHIDFNTLVPGLDKEYVRQAIAHGVDRETIAETLIAPVNPDVEVLHNPIYMSNQPMYEPYYSQWDYNPDAATSLLEDNGCEQGDGGIWECEGDRLSFRIGTTGGNERRELAQQLIQANLADIGIEIEIDNDEGAAFFERLNTPENCGGPCDYDIAMFAWVGSPDPVGNANIYGCDDGEPRPQNWTVWCNEDATNAFDTANSTIDEDERIDLFNEAASIMADEVPILPLFQQPQLLAWDNNITGPQLNATNATNLWNSGDWARFQ